MPDQFRSIYSHAVEFPQPARQLHISGQVGVARDGALPGNFAAQCGQAMDNVEAILAAAGMTMSHVVKLTYFLTRAADLPSLGDIRRRRWAAPNPPAVTVLVVAALARPDFLVEIEGFAASPG